MDLITGISYNFRTNYPKIDKSDLFLKIRISSNVSEEVLNDFIKILQETAKGIKNLYVKIN